MVTSQALAQGGIGRRDREKQNPYSQEDCVGHG
jgi:hypothetical protein